MSHASISRYDDNSTLEALVLHRSLAICYLSFVFLNVVRWLCIFVMAHFSKDLLENDEEKFSRYMKSDGDKCSFESLLSGSTYC